MAASRFLSVRGKPQQINLLSCSTVVSIADASEPDLTEHRLQVALKLVCQT